MKTLNKIILFGFVVADPKISKTKAGLDVANFSLVTNYYTIDDKGNQIEIPEYHDCSAWKGNAKIVYTYVKKGSKVFIEGRIKTNEYIDRLSVKRKKTEVVAERIILPDINHDIKVNKEDVEDPLDYTI